jgi:predicted NAD-dependent protein-ADP-ribosyltransferase YbiA (DUF1768 family)
MQASTNTDIPDRLRYYSKSRDVKPGKGAGEAVKSESVYSKLKEIKDWRQILSNFYVEPFKFDGFTWRTVEHVFQSKKIGLVDSDAAHCFTVESGHEIGKGDGSVAQKNRKLRKLSAEKLAEWDSIKDALMTDATRERIKQSDVYRDVLLKTNDAELWHYVSRKPAVRNVYLEKLRAEFASPRSDGVEDAKELEDEVVRPSRKSKRRVVVDDNEELEDEVIGYLRKSKRRVIDDDNDD